MTDDPAEFPQPGPLEPQIARGPLWACLLTPTAATIVACLIMPIAGTEGYFYRLWFLPLIAGPITGFICTPWFVRMMKARYRGRSLVLTSIGYSIGQLILTPALGFGGCILVGNTIG